MNHLERALDHQNHLGKYLTVLFVVFIGCFISFIPIAGIVDHYENTENVTLNQNLDLALGIFPFAISVLLMVFMIKRMHQRSIAEIMNGTKLIRWKKVFFSFIICAILFSFSFILEYWINKENFIFQFEWNTWIPLLFISFLFVPIVVAFEEISLRGYLAQGIGAWTRNRWLVIVITGTISILLNYNSNVKEFGFWLTMSVYLLGGLGYSLISVLDDGIESVIGIRTAFLLFHFLFVTDDSVPFQTPAMFKTLESTMEFSDVLFLMLFLGTLLLILYRKYRWDFSVLNQKIKYS